MAEQPWFTTRQLGPGLWVLQDPIGRVAPEYDVAVVNLYLVAGQERAALIDSGMGLGPLREACAALTDRPILNLCSHSHWDHIAGSASFEQRLIHPLEAARLDRSYDVEGVTHVRAAPATGLLREGDEIALGGRALRVWHTPGHSPGHVSFLDTLSGALFCGDTCYAGTMWMQTEDADLTQQAASLERLAASGASALYGGHDEPVQQPALARRALEALARARAGQAPSEPFPGDASTRKYRFEGFSILLPA